MAASESTTAHATGMKSSTRDERPLLGAFGLIGAVLMLLASMWTSPMTVVGFSCLLLVSGFGFAAFAWLKGMAQHEHRASAWDVAGLLVLAGFAGLIGANTVLF